MKFLLFSDLHHCPGVFMGGTWEDLALIQRRAEEENCDFIIHAGDFSHGPSTVPEYTKAYNDFHIPSYHVLGNHDTDSTMLEETLRLYNMPAPNYYFDCGGYRFIAVDTNHFRDNGEYIHFSEGNYYSYEDRGNYVGPQQLRWLEETINTSPYSCVLLSHASFERAADGSKDMFAVQKIINDANKRKPNSVLMCINGHYHRDFMRILDNVCYLDMNSASYDWVETRHNCFPEELCKEYIQLNHTVVFNDPLHAIVTLEGNTIDIKGMESSMFMGVTRKETGHQLCDAAGRPVVPQVHSVRITLG